jgi:hypothetical protein
MEQTGSEQACRDAPTVDPLLAPRLSTNQLEFLQQYGKVRSTTSGEVLFREGDREYVAVPTTLVPFPPLRIEGSGT